MNILIFCVIILVTPSLAGVMGQDLVSQDAPLLRTGRHGTERSRPNRGPIAHRRRFSFPLLPSVAPFKLVIREKRGPFHLERDVERTRRTGNCTATFCFNGGRCLNTREGLAYCTCSNGYKGDRCQTEVTCAERPCDILGYGGICVEDRGGDGVGVGNSDTVGGAVGVGEAVSNSKRRKYRCDCSPGYLGLNCEKCAAGFVRSLFACIPK